MSSFRLTFLSPLGVFPDFWLPETHFLNLVLFERLLHFVFLTMRLVCITRILTDFQKPWPSCVVIQLCKDWRHICSFKYKNIVIFARIEPKWHTAMSKFYLTKRHYIKLSIWIQLHVPNPCIILLNDSNDAQAAGHIRQNISKLMYWKDNSVKNVLSQSAGALKINEDVFHNGHWSYLQDYRGFTLN